MSLHDTLLYKEKSDPFQKLVDTFIMRTDVQCNKSINISKMLTINYVANVCFGFLCLSET